MERFRLAVMGLVVLVFVLAILWSYLVAGSDAPTYPYSQLVADAADGKVAAVVQRGTQLTVRLNGEPEPRTVEVASESINVYAELCAAAGAPLGDCPIAYEAQGEDAAGQWIGLLITSLLPVLLISTFIFFMMRRARQNPPPPV